MQGNTCQQGYELPAILDRNWKGSAKKMKGARSI